MTHLTTRPKVVDDMFAAPAGSRCHPGLALLVVALTATAAGCEDEPIPTRSPRVCTTATCPAGWCEITISFDTNCVGQLDLAEILIDGALEPGVARPGQTFVSTGHVPVTESSVFWVRAEDWQWRVSFRCDNPATDGTYQLACTRSDDGTIEIGDDVEEPGDVTGSEDASP